MAILKALARMRAQRMLVESHAEDLSMSAVEAAPLLRKAGLELEFGAVQALVRRDRGLARAAGAGSDFVSAAT